MNKRTEELLENALELFSEKGDSELGNAIEEVERLYDKTDDVTFRNKCVMVLSEIYERLTKKYLVSEEPAAIKQPVLIYPFIQEPEKPYFPKYGLVRQIGEMWGSSNDNFSLKFPSLGQCVTHFSRA